MGGALVTEIHVYPVKGEDGEELWIRAVALSLDGALSVRRSASGPPEEAAAVGRRLAAEMTEDGAGSLLTDSSPVT